MTTLRITSVLSAVLLATATFSTSTFACNGPAGYRGGFGPRFQAAPQAQVTPFQLWQFLCKNPQLCGKHPAIALQLQKQFGPIPGANLGAVQTPVINAGVAPVATGAPVANAAAVTPVAPNGVVAATVPANAVAPAPVAALKPPAPPLAPNAVVSAAAPSVVPANEVAAPVTPVEPAAPVTVAAQEVPQAAAPVPAPAASEETPVVENSTAATTPNTIPDDLPIGEDVGG
jgi:hypothetical protein